jgi:peptide/nickel transport system substrate-binding protein
LWTLQGSIYPQGTAWFDAAAPGYNQGNPEKAAALLKQAGYNREPIRVLTSYSTTTSTRPRRWSSPT